MTAPRQRFARLIYEFEIALPEPSDAAPVLSGPGEHFEVPPESLGIDFTRLREYLDQALIRSGQLEWSHSSQLFGPRPIDVEGNYVPMELWASPGRTNPAIGESFVPRDV
jgi:hypothetical protein